MRLRISDRSENEFLLPAAGISLKKSFDGQLIAVISQSDIIEIFGSDGSPVTSLVASKTIENSYETFEHTFLDADFSFDSHKIIAGLTDGTARLWNLSGQEILCLKGHQGDVVRVWFSQSENSIFTFSLDGTFRVWDLNGNQVSVIGSPKRRFSWEGRDLDSIQISDYASQVSMSPDRQFVFFVFEDDELSNPGELWSIDGSKKAIFEVVDECVTRPVLFDPNSYTILTSCTDGTVRIWSLDGTLRKVLSDVKASQLSISSDGKKLLVATAHGNLSLWNLEAGKKIKEREQAHEFLAISSLSFHSTGELILTSGFNDGTIKIWDLDLNLVALLHRGDTFIKDVRERVVDVGQIVSAGFSVDNKHVFAISREAADSPGYLMWWKIAIASGSVVVFWIKWYLHLLNTQNIEPDQINLWSLELAYNPASQQQKFQDQEAKDISSTTDFQIPATSYQDVLTSVKRLPLPDRLKLIREATASIEQDLVTPSYD